MRPEGGRVERVLANLPTLGDHDVNYLVFDRDGNLYFGLGSATNSGVVSSDDPVNKQWLPKHPQATEIPCRDIVLTGAKFTEPNKMTRDPNDTATTGAYQPYGRSDATRIPAGNPCTTALYRLRPGSTTPELMAWGFRNPVALAFDDDGQLYIGMHGADLRSTRPIENDPDAIYCLRTMRVGVETRF